MRTIYYNANVKTMDDQKKEATAIVVDDGMIIYVGNDKEAFPSDGCNQHDHDTAQASCLRSSETARQYFRGIAPGRVCQA